MKLKALDLTLASMFVGLMAIGANITALVPFMVIGGVPITLQTFFAILAGIILGSRLGAISMTVYALVGLAGVPVFAQFSAGFSTLISPTFGFILSFILTAYVAGKVVKNNRSLAAFISAALAGLFINYVVGTNWMYFAYKLWAAAPEGFTYKLAWLWMVAPLPKDIILAVLAGMMGHRLERTILSKGSFKHLRKAV
ncbi:MULTISPECIES: biotin transporter BioY [Mesobacillus]|uniref:Biotin transporter n=2 Tax=Mesobacillus TaxID=2675231 RepID=A0A0D6ZCM6_9BACI|nr:MULTISPECIES: biotin transporter BioY [Mesobacillus]KIY22806.1 biotin biosynthesis protein BioC [Mesobacillus subterraneus]MDQ0413225.1 biotin transport system substrate-specific component [Mesobacillus stamsii]